MDLQSTLKGYVCQLKNRKSRNGRTVDDSSETLVPTVPFADEADALAAEALFDGEDIAQLRLGRYFVVVGRGGLRKIYNVRYDRSFSGDKFSRTWSTSSCIRTGRAWGRRCSSAILSSRCSHSDFATRFSTLHLPKSHSSCS